MSRNMLTDLQEELLGSICTAGAPDGAIRLQCYPRSLEDWLGVSHFELHQNLHPLMSCVVMIMICAVCS